jgi:4-hydroxybenzoate polyprenyltransferase
LKTIPVLDIFIVAIGFVLRVKAGAVIIVVGLSEWLTIMVFLLALFMAIGKRRDDVLLKLSLGTDMRKSIKGYNLELMNVLTAWFVPLSLLRISCTPCRRKCCATWVLTGCITPAFLFWPE